MVEKVDKSDLEKAYDEVTAVVSTGKPPNKMAEDLYNVVLNKVYDYNDIESGFLAGVILGLRIG